jgi:hypothetical protein
MGEKNECTNNFGGGNLQQNAQLEDQEGDLKVGILVKLCEDRMWMDVAQYHDRSWALVGSSNGVKP